MPDNLDPKQDNQDPNWKETLIPDDVRTDPVFENFKSPADVFRSYVKAQKFLGREKLPVPVDENDTETRNLILKRLGLPENEQGYQFPTDLEIPEHLPVDQNLMEGFRKKAHELGILPSQFSGIYKWYMENILDAYNKFGEDKKSSLEEADKALRGEYGAAYQQNLTLANKVLASFGDEKSVEAIEREFGNNPELIRVLVNIGKAMSEDQLAGKPPALTLSPAEAQLKLNEIKSNMKHPYWDANNPAHKQAVEEFTRLQKLALMGSQ